jgi:hypothetical protein
MTDTTMHQLKAAQPDTAQPDTAQLDEERR